MFLVVRLPCVTLAHLRTKRVLTGLLTIAALLPLPVLALVSDPEYRSCIRQAIDEREGATVSLTQQYNRDIESVLQERHAGLVNAWSLENDSDIRDEQREVQLRYRERERDAREAKRDAEREISNRYRERERTCRDEQRRRQEEERQRIRAEEERQREEERLAREEERRLRQEEDARRREEERLRREEGRSFSSRRSSFTSSRSRVGDDRIGQCTSSTQCVAQLGEGHVCTVEQGDCLRLCPPEAFCPAVCAGFCVAGQSRFSMPSNIYSPTDTKTYDPYNYNYNYGYGY